MHVGFSFYMQRVTRGWGNDNVLFSELGPAAFLLLSAYDITG